jgi:CDP-glycerol glycerophosphotransferase (TagB/SpsB family)
MSSKDCDIQELLKKSMLMVTDYSSVFFDFVCMKKNVVFYQFDYEQYRMGQYAEGYFDYQNNGFSQSVRKLDEAFQKIEQLLENNCKISDEFTKAHKE